MTDPIRDRLDEIEALWKFLPRCEECGDFATGTIHNPAGRRYACGMCRGPDFLGFSSQPPLTYIEPAAQLVAALRDVLALHRPERLTTYGLPVFDEYDRSTETAMRCVACQRDTQREWPCPTVKAIASALGVDL